MLEMVPSEQTAPVSILSWLSGTKIKGKINIYRPITLIISSLRLFQAQWQKCLFFFFFLNREQMKLTLALPLVRGEPEGWGRALTNPLGSHPKTPVGD